MARTKSYHYAIADNTSMVNCGKDVIDSQTSLDLLNVYFQT